MTIMLAQITPEMLKGIPGWLVSAGALLWITNEIFKLAKNIRGKEPLPPNEQLELSHGALVERVDNIEGDIKGIRSELKEDRSANERHASARSSAIYKKIDDMRAEITAHVESVRRELSGNQNDIPDRIVAMLKNTGAIKG